jgi:undecaprenyl-diphosphatase
MGVNTAQLEPVGATLDPAETRSDRSAPRHARHEPPLLEPRPGGPAERFAAAVGYGHPVRVFLAAAVGGYVLLVAFMTALGFLLTKVLLEMGGFAAWDEHISKWLADHRTPLLVDLSWVGSTVAGGVVIPVLVGGLLLLFCLHRRWRLAAFTLFVICIESGGYRATSLIVHRDRPDVHRLETLPVNASYPSGHTAASLALYGGLLFVLSSRIESLRLRVLVWALALAMPVFVGWSRMERGMHHLTDSIAGIILGTCAILITIFAARAAGAAAAQRESADR